MLSISFPENVCARLLLHAVALSRGTLCDNNSMKEFPNTYADALIVIGLVFSTSFRPYELKQVLKYSSILEERATMLRRVTKLS